MGITVCGLIQTIFARFNPWEVTLVAIIAQ
jgi:hypothetical protein